MSKRVRSILSSVLVIIITIVSMVNTDGLVVHADSNFITINVYDSYGKCVDVFYINGLNKNMTSSNPNIVIEGNKIKCIDSSCFGYYMDNMTIQQGSNSFKNYLKSVENDGIVYDSSGNQKELILLEFADMSDVEFNSLAGTVLRVDLKEKTVNRTFKTDRGRVTSEHGVAFGASYNLVSNLKSKHCNITLGVSEAEGYDLVGWRGSVDNKLYVVGSSIDLTIEQEYTAEFKSQKRTITYIGYNGNVIKTEQADYNSKVTFPKPEEVPKVEGKEFKYWCTMPSLSENYADTEMVVRGDKTIYAVYNTAINTIIYTNGVEDVTKKAEYGSKFSGTTELDKKGYTIVWKDKNGKVYDSNTIIKQDVTLYAEYIPQKINIKIVKNGGDVEFERCNIVDGQIDFGDKIIIRAIDKYGYSALKVTYNNMEIGADADGKYIIEIKQDYDSVITIEYTKNKHTLRYIDELNKLDEEKNDVYFQEEITMPEYGAKEGYKFKGWQLSTGEIKQPGEKAIMPNKNLTITALWENINYTVKIDLDGGYFTESSENTDNAIVLNIGNTYKLSKPIKEGNEFMGWTADKGQISGNLYTMGSSDDIVKALWKKKKFYITVMPNGGFFKGQTNIQSIVGEYQDIIEIETPIREGYTFKCWEVLSGDSSLIKDNKINCGIGSITIGAVWINSSGDIIDNKYNQYIKPVDGTIDSSVIMNDKGLVVQYSGSETSLSVRDNSSIKIDKTNGIYTDYNTIVNGNSTIDFDKFNNITSMKYLAVPSGIDSKTVNPNEGDWKTTTGAAISLGDIETDGEYNIYFLLETAQGKKIMFRSTGFTLDKTCPTLNNIENGGCYTGEIIISVNDKTGISSLKLNGADINNNTKIKQSGVYTVDVVDNAYNNSSITFKLDNNKPTANIKHNKNYNKTMTIKVKDNLSGIKSIKLNGKSVKNNSKVTKDGKYTLIIEDNVGNRNTIKFKIDKVKPTINIKNNSVIKGKIKIKAKDSLTGIKYIKLDNKKIKNGAIISKKGKHTLKIYDKSGNIRTIKFRIK